MDQIKSKTTRSGNFKVLKIIIIDIINMFFFRIEKLRDGPRSRLLGNTIFARERMYREELRKLTKLMKIITCHFDEREL